MYEHHRRAIDRLRERLKDDPEVIALVIVGSIARGEAREDSDIDAYLVVTEGEFSRRRDTGQLLFKADDVCDFPHGEAAATVIPLSFLQAAAERGPEPTRFAFLGAFAPFSRVDRLETLLSRIPIYPEVEREEKMTSFASQLPIHLSYMALAEYSRNPYLLAETAVELVLFGGRLILAHNQMLYPGRKQFLRQLENAPEKPAGMLELAKDLLERPGIATSRAFCSSVLGYREWPQASEGAMARFQRDREQVWLSGAPALADS